MSFFARIIPRKKPAPKEEHKAPSAVPTYSGATLCPFCKCVHPPGLICESRRFNVKFPPKFP